MDPNYQYVTSRHDLTACIVPGRVALAIARIWDDEGACFACHVLWVGEDCIVARASLRTYSEARQRLDQMTSKRRSSVPIRGPIDRQKEALASG